MPRVVDLNGDGLLDILVGCAQFGLGSDGYGAPGGVLYYRNTGTRSTPAFHNEGAIKTISGTTILAPSYSYSATGDLNGDGLTDIVMKRGSLTPTCYDVYLNEGTTTTPAFGEAIGLEFDDGTPATTNGNIWRFAVADWNGDGAADLLCTESNFLYEAPVKIILAVPSQTKSVPTAATAAATAKIRYDARSGKLSIGGTGVGNLSLIALSGRCIARHAIDTEQKSIQIGSLPQGVFAIVNRDGVVSTKLLTRE